MEVYERNTMFTSRQRQYCESSTAAMDFKSSDSRIFVRLRAASLSRQPAFTALVTVFQPAVLVGLIGGIISHYITALKKIPSPGQ